MISEALLAEINLLTLFNPETIQEGIKIHTHANPAIHEAAQRLFDKGIISQSDGGYLTDLGIEVAEHTQKILTILTSD